MSSAFFLCISALPIPLSTNTFKIFVNTVTNAITPYASGAKRRARTIDTTNAMPCAPHLSANLQKKFLVIFVLLVILSI